MKTIKGKLRKLLSFLVIFSILFTILGLSSNVIKAAELFTELEWSDYVWRSYTDNSNITKIYHKDDPSHEALVYYYQEVEEIPSATAEAPATYKKGTLNSKTIPLTPLYGRDIHMVISRGYPMNKENLIKKFGENLEVLYRGTQLAIWATLHRYDQSNWERFVGEEEAVKVAKYIAGISETNSQYTVGKEYVDEPNTLPVNLCVSYFEPKDDTYQGLLALEDVQDPTKDHPRISVQIKWNLEIKLEELPEEFLERLPADWSEDEIKNFLKDQEESMYECLPTVTVNVKRNDTSITYLELNHKNQWTASYIDEVESNSQPSYIVSEFEGNFNDREVIGGKIILGHTPYLVEITGSQQDGFIVTNTLKMQEEKIRFPVSIRVIGADTKEDLKGAILEIHKLYNGIRELQIKLITNGKEEKIELEEGWYELTEISAPKGYKKIDKNIVLWVRSDGEVWKEIPSDEGKTREAETGAEQWIKLGSSIILENAPIARANITIKKVASDTQSDLSGAKLKITKSDSSPVQGGEWVTDGTEKVFNLQEGEYILQEVEVPKGYTKADDISFRITDTGKLEVKQDDVYKEQSDLVITMMDNKLLSHEITFSKVEVNQTEELEGATLRIYEGEVSTTPEVAPIKEWVSTKEQQKVSLQAGTYTMVEIQAPNGYEVAENIAFKVLEDGTIQVKENGNWANRANATVQMQDVKIPKVPEKSHKITFSKVEVNTTNELEGANLQIFSGEAINVEPLHTWISTKEQRKISLKEGIYTMVEKQAPDGYEVAENIVFQVLSNGAIQIKENGNWVERANSMVRMEDRKKEIPPSKEKETPPEEVPPSKEKEIPPKEVPPSKEKEIPPKEVPSSKDKPSLKEKEKTKKETTRKKDEPKENLSQKKRLDYLMGLKGKRYGDNEVQNPKKTNSLKLTEQVHRKIELDGSKNKNKDFALYGNKIDSMGIVKTGENIFVTTYIWSCLISLIGIFLLYRKKYKVK